MTAPALSVEAFARLEVHSRIIDALEYLGYGDVETTLGVLRDLDREITAEIRKPQVAAVRNLHARPLTEVTMRSAGGAE